MMCRDDIWVTFYVHYTFVVGVVSKNRFAATKTNTTSWLCSDLTLGSLALGAVARIRLRVAALFGHFGHFGHFGQSIGQIEYERRIVAGPRQQ